MAHSLLEHPECLAALTTRRPSNVPVPAAAGRDARWHAALISIGLGACVGCFTDPINRAPVVTSIEADSPVMRDKPASFTATAYDPDSDTPTISWAQASGDCPDLSRPPPPTTTGERFSVDDKVTTGAFCVWAFATDRYGAVGMKNRSVVPSNLPPVAMIELLSPDATSLYPLYSTFELADGSTDPEQDPVTSEWTLTPAPGSLAQWLTSGCSMAGSGNDVHCFKADVPGAYTVKLTATTPDGQSSLAMQTYVANVDVLPCIEMPDPPLDGTQPLDPTQANSFTVAWVEDDGDRLGSAHFTWFITVDGVLRPVENDFPTLLITHDTYHEGDTSKVRVEVYDRNRQAVDDALRVCGDAADTCQGDPQRPTCSQRVTWTVNWL